MDYEEYYQPFKQTEKDVSDNLRRQQAAFKGISKDAARGDLKSLSKDINAMDALISEYKAHLQKLRDLSDGFDAHAYIESGDFAKQMLECCHDMGVDVKGGYPSYEMFPYKVKIDGANQDIYINNRRLPCVRPQYLVSDIRQSREKLLKASFNANTFLNELADAYDKLAVIKSKEEQGKNRDPKLLLRELYRFMTPLQRFRRDYELQSFAFDLSRLYASDIEFTKDGRQYDFGPARTQSQNIRILDKNGKEAFVGTITFFSNETASE